MRKIAIIGHFGGGENSSDGQTVKTTIVTQEIETLLGKDCVSRVNTYRWKENPFRLLINCAKSVRKCENVMFLTDEGGIKIFPKLLYLLNFSGHCKLHYYVVGGWLHNYLDQSKHAIADLKKLDVIYVEIPTMQKELNERGVHNVILVNKFRRMTPVSEEELDFAPIAPYKLCYFSRVMKEKGVEECIAAVKSANEVAGFTKYTLDIFGSIHGSYKKDFEMMRKAFPDFIRYCGIVDFQKSGEVLKDYFAMLFPTYYASEGYPNALVDAFAAGLPVIATKWNYNGDIIRDREDGILVDAGSVEQIVEAIEALSSDLHAYGNMRRNCLCRCEEYLPENAISKVIVQLK